MRRVLIFLLMLLPMGLSAQEFVIRRGDCMPQLEDTTATVRQRAPRRLPAVRKDWDSTRVYKQMLVLVEFEQDSVYFSTSDPKATYDDMFNKAGYNQRKGKGCVADYYREQSKGLLNLQFDIYGPYKVAYKAQPYEMPTDETRNYGKNPMRAAVQMLIEENPEMDFSPYDWNGDGTIEQVAFVTAGYAGNVGLDVVYGYLWPNTSSFTTINTPDGKKISNYSATAELWPNKASYGIATFCHEFSHSLGLPDIYPVPGWTYSAVDEWDLMDGGNFTNLGWCPPNYSPLEKMLLGWLKPIELTEPTTVTQLQPTSKGGEVYQVKHTDTEYLLLENRQWDGWDAGVPGQGLVIYHVNYIASKWTGNSVNGTKNVFNYDIFHADNRDYVAWDKIVQDGKTGNYRNSGWMNNYHLSGSPYPYAASDEEVNDSLTDNSVPAAKMLTTNSQGSDMLSKPITNIKLADDGTISFDFMGGGVPLGLQGIRQHKNAADRSLVYDLNGRPCTTISRHGFYLERRADGTVRKFFK